MQVALLSDNPDLTALLFYAEVTNFISKVLCPGKILSLLAFCQGESPSFCHNLKQPSTEDTRCIQHPW
jgi:hypothetical protein